MSVLTSYLAEVLVYSGIFAAYYGLFMRKASFIRWNRWYILSAMVLAMLLPLIVITISIPVSTVASPIAIDDAMLIEEVLAISDGNASTGSTGVVRSVFFIAYSLISFLLMLVGAKGIWSIYLLKRNNKYSRLDAVKLYSCSENIAPFSFFRNIFFPRNILPYSAEGQQVLQHELEHVHACHSLDKVLVQLLCIACWFNSFFWFFRRELGLVHEFLADRASVKEGGAEEFSKLILCTLYPASNVSFGNQFFQSPIKRRLAMITNSKTNNSSLRKLLIIPVTAACLLAFSVTLESKPIPPTEAEPSSENQLLDSSQLIDEPLPEPQPAPQPPQSVNSSKDIAYEEVQVKPTFLGQNANAFISWVDSRIEYPLKALDENIQGKVLLKFRIAEDGTLGDVEVLRGVDPLLDSEAVRLVKQSPPWKAGEHNGKKVGVIYTFPVNFTLTPEDAREPQSVQPPASTADMTYDEVQVKPTFQEQSANAFSKWIASRIVYPQKALDKSIQGKVTLQFRIAEDGTLGDVKVLRGVDPLLDSEAVRVVKQSPLWKAGEHNGKKVGVIYTFPVNFTLTPEGAREPQSEQPQPDKELTFAEVLEKPRFNGDEDGGSFTKWVAEQFKYPAEAAEQKLEGRAILKFVVTKDGDVSKVQLLRSSGSTLLDDEAMRVIKLSPKWQPAVHNNKKVDVTYTFPVNFKL